MRFHSHVGTLRVESVSERDHDLRSADDVDAYVGGQVRVRRMMLGISQEQLGEALGLTFQQIQKYEKGQNRIGAGRLYRISQILSVPVEFFYQGLPSAEDTAEARDAAERNAEVQRFLASAEGHGLTTAFLRIKDAATRRRLIDLVNTIASGAENV
jgi:transcriptional regulator with XRE-family HTH domain